MLDEKILEYDKAYLIEITAEHALNEMEVIKLENLLHQLSPEKMPKVIKICDYIIENELMALPEDEIIDALRKAEIT